MAKKDDGAEKHISAKRLGQLVQANRLMQSSIGEAREEYGEKIKAAVEKENLHKGAFAVACKLNKMDSGKASRYLRALNLYCDMLQIGGQGDLVDEVAAQEAAEAGYSDDDGRTAWVRVEGEWEEGVLVEDHEDGSAVIRVGDTVVSCTDGHQWTLDDPTPKPDVISKLVGLSPLLDPFKAALTDLDTPEAVAKALDLFVSDHPTLQPEAEGLAAERVRVIASKGNVVQLPTTDAAAPAKRGRKKAAPASATSDAQKVDELQSIAERRRKRYEESGDEPNPLPPSVH